MKTFLIAWLIVMITVPMVAAIIQLHKNNKIEDLRLYRSGRYYYIEIFKNKTWIVCKTKKDIKKIYKGELIYPFRNKEEAINHLAIIKLGKS